MYAITGAFRQFCFDRAVTTFGVSLEAELDSIDGANAQRKRERLIDKWLDRPMKYRSVEAPTDFAHPTGDVEQQVTIPGDGMQ